ncbi:capsule assembly Wzi family protein [Acinetobacter qingfengensis]|uniref:Uncharacterized protein n=1 Tax=Acinetobacter qingfengensis TaxID=1262585 RepID=A0A1E7RDN0_9GAMM|nr:capsule assembly Wzi family protein [Acinetobacter qingfengensis]KAA8732174.1 capsule assembly Wzi family protein [Acinetobacter qingfengensis]OEY97275.1 hypothetical protein BJI46_01450 [Acinetobacter qingfengensis]
MTFRKKVLCITLLSCSSSLALAQGLIENDANLRDDLNWLNQQGVIQISTSTWPLSGEEVTRALANAKVSTSEQQHVITAIEKNLKLKNSTLKLDLQAQSDSKAVPQAFAEDRDAEYKAAVEFNSGAENWDVKLRVNAESNQIIDNGDKVNVEGSYIAGKLWNQWLAFGQIPTWWGPGHDGSLIRGDASRPVTGFTLQRAEQKAFENKWLSWIGPWQYQLFAGQLQDYQAVPDAKLLGMRLTVQPLPYLELGASRTLQWGGKGRSQSLSTLWDAIKGNDNVDDTSIDKSNQHASFDAKLSLYHWFNLPVSIYGELDGEDEAGKLPSRNMYLVGIDYSSSFKKMPYQIYAEWADTRTSGKVWGYSYWHGVYTDGYYQNGYPLGHSIGGDGQMYSLGGNMRIDPMNKISGRVVWLETYASAKRFINTVYPEQDKIKALDLTWTNTFRPDLSLKINGWLTDSDLHGRDTGASVGLEFALDKVLLGK